MRDAKSSVQPVGLTLLKRDFAAHRGTAAAATTSASVRRSMSCTQEQPTEGVRPNARENSQMNPSTIVRAARAAGSQPYLPSGFQGR